MDPDSSIWLELALLGFFLLLTALAAGAETALTFLDRARLRELLKKEGSRPQALDTLLNDPYRALASLLLLNDLGLIGAAGSAMLIIPHLVPGWVRALGAVLALATIFLFQLAPKALAARSPERMALRLAGLIHGLAALFSPLLGLLRLSSGLGPQLVAGELSVVGFFMNEEERRFWADVGREDIEEEEREMIHGIIELGETLAREVMVPRIDMVAIEAGTPLLEALDVIIQCGHSRIPVYEESIDHIIGLLYAKDLLRYLRDGQTAIPLREILRPVYFIPESKKVDDLLQELQRMRIHIAIVVDEYGGTAGLVTIEDLLEEIVGEIQDEYDMEEPIMELVSDNEIIFDARIDLDDVNHLMAIALPTEDSDTLGGLIYSRLGKVPAVGDEVVFDGVKIAVLSLIGRRIKKVRVTKEGTPGPAGEVEPARA